MEKKGKSLENIILLIQETLKNSPETKVFKNYKIENNGGREREFDIFIESNINGFEIKIAIECKDYKGRVPVEKIEAFESKCKRIIDINKKVFVSSNGFQTDAINAAKEFGIELQIAAKLDINSIRNWFPINSIDFKILDGGTAVLIIDSDDEESQNDIPISAKLTYNNDETNVNEIIVNILNTNRTRINKIGTFIWLRLDDELKKSPFFIPLNAYFKLPYLLNHKNKVYKVMGLQLNLRAAFEYSQVKIKEIRQLKGINGELRADTLTIQIDNETTGSFVRTPDNNTSVHISKNNESSRELKVLATYNPKTDKFDVK